MDRINTQVIYRFQVLDNFVNVCKQNMTSLSLLAGRTVPCYFSMQTNTVGVGMPGFMSPRISSPAHPASGGATPGRGRGGGGMKRDREMIGQTVRIVQGPFKGISIGPDKHKLEA